MTDRPPDATSASSEDSFRPPPRLDSSRIKPGPGALPADAFDPLKHEDWEQFWYHIDSYYQPINQDHVRFLRAIPVNPYSAARDEHLRLPPPVGQPVELGGSGNGSGNGNCNGGEGGEGGEGRGVDQGCVGGNGDGDGGAEVKGEGGEVGGVMTALNSFPFTHRLVAAMLDAGGQASASINMSVKPRGGGDAGRLWIGVGGEEQVRDFQVAYEERVRVELVERGLVDGSDDDELQRLVRQEQWKLRDVKQMVRLRKTALYTQIIGVELRAQAIRREIKKHHDHVEMAYLERMVNKLKKNKKSRSKFQKLLHRVFGHYKDKDKAVDKIKKAAEAITNGKLLTNGDDKGRSMGKKKKKRSDVVALKVGSSSHANLSKKGVN